MVAPFAIAAGLIGLSTLLGVGRSHWNAREQREMLQRQEDYNRQESDEWNQRMADYERNTGLRPHYRFTGKFGRSEYLKHVQLPSYSNLYSQNNANVWTSGFQALSSLGATGAYAYGKYTKSDAYRSAVEEDRKWRSVMRDPSKIGPM